MTVWRARGRERGVRGWEGGGLQAGNRSRSARTPHRVGVDVARQVDEPVDDCLRHLGGVKGGGVGVGARGIGVRAGITIRAAGYKQAFI